ncbi:methionyl-tRNA formyltransferase protein [Marine Group I thaumarchaeote SCGC AAA799-E16]|uniref:Methionyl-tRNA formyltransferase protein n=4 Tax=Marine Group I TaxID=905826 RepID=A0A087RVZ4_9ARCH|nr:methionyl-tRNA formyltransferase protein [Marine Group I thaumarchaeote SCGC AAA799-E16]KFM17648.1 methionyl-tRNA formyltransferase protein [Marine Group I thaumarchaeote SCGC RSA3]
MGTKLHVAVDCNGLPVSIVTSCANEHDSTKFIDVMENISECLDDEMIQQIVSVYADKGYDAKYIRMYLRNRNLACCIPYKKNSKLMQNNAQRNYNKTRYVVERFFAWLKCGFRRTAIRYERVAENYLGFINIASFLMYCRVLR